MSTHESLESSWVVLRAHDLDKGNVHHVVVELRRRHVSVDVVGRPGRVGEHDRAVYGRPIAREANEPAIKTELVRRGRSERAPTDL